MFMFVALLILCGCSSPKLRFAYVATGQGVYAFRMDASNGAASQIFGSPFVAKTNGNNAASASSVVVDPSNRFVYVADQNIDSISVFKINPTTGALTEIMPRIPLTAPGLVGLSPAAMTMDSGGKFLFVGNQNSTDVWVFSIADSGALTFVSRTLLAAGPSGLTLSASGDFLYVPVPTFSAVYAFSVSSGTLTQVGTPFVVSGGVGNNVGIDPNGQFLYVPNPSTNTVTVLRIQPDGSLGFGAGAFATGTTPVAAATNATGAFVYVANFGSTNLSQFQLDTTTGQLVPLSSSTAGTGTQPSSIIVDPTAKFIFVVNQKSNSVTEFTANTNGTLASTGNSLQLSVAPRSFSVTR